MSDYLFESGSISIPPEARTPPRNTVSVRSSTFRSEQCATQPPPTFSAAPTIARKIAPSTPPPPDCAPRIAFHLVADVLPESAIEPWAIRLILVVRQQRSYFCQEQIRHVTSQMAPSSPPVSLLRTCLPYQSQTQFQQSQQSHKRGTHSAI